MSDERDEPSGKGDPGPGGPGDDSPTEGDGPDEGTDPSGVDGDADADAEYPFGRDEEGPSGTDGPNADAGASATATGGRGDADVETTVSRERSESGDSLLAALVSFLVPGLGNVLNGQTERGAIIFLLWVLWLFVGWGVGAFFLGALITVLTLGIGAIVWFLIVLVVGVIEFAIHVLAAVDAYHQSEIVDNVTVRVNEVRGS